MAYGSDWWPLPGGHYVVDSKGGDLCAAARLARRLRILGCTVEVRGECSSAAQFLLAAGNVVVHDGTSGLFHAPLCVRNPACFANIDVSHYKLTWDQMKDVSSELWPNRSPERWLDKDEIEKLRDSLRWRDLVFSVAEWTR